MSDNFDLKKYLVENKATTNSRMLNEALDFKVKLLVPTVYYDVASGELADSPNEWYTEDELEDADVTSYTDGTELATVVFDSDMARAKQMEKQYPGLFKVMPTGGMAEMKKKHSKMMKENTGNFFIDFKSEFANYIQDYEEGGLDEEVNVVDTNMGIDEWYQYPKTSVLVNHAVKSLKAAGVDSIEKLYAKNNLKYAGESLDEFFQNLKVNETYRGVDFTLIPGVDFSFTEEV